MTGSPKAEAPGPEGIAARTAIARPPQLPFVFSVGVTGHRSDALPAGATERIAAELRTALRLIHESACSVHAAARSRSSDEAPRLQMVSPLADGADQLAAEAALDLGFRMHAVLPFSREDYRASLMGNGALARFDALLARSECVLELPGDPADDFDAYVMTGRATIAHCDLLIAVWDGLSPRGRGGTAEVVDLAMARGSPVLHIPVDSSLPPRLLWSAFDPAVVTSRVEPLAERPFDRQHLDELIGALLLPPPDPAEHRFLELFLGERPRRIRGRIEYPLLLAAAGVSRFRTRQVRDSSAAEDIEREWREYKEGCASRHHVSAPLQLLEDAYSWSDRLAAHFAQTYRSGHIFNFVLGGVAVCLGLIAFIAPHAKLGFAIAEFACALAIVVNTQVGRRHEWHRRWLDYRQLAERLRPMRSLKLLGLAAPDPPGTPTNPLPRRWVDWYARGVWRAMGCPAGAISRESAGQLASAVAEFEVAPQVAYHERHAREIDALDHRLEALGTLLFLATLVACVTTVAGLLVEPHTVERFSDWATLVSAGFPALGTAVFGIRLQADFGGSAVRSKATAEALRQIEQELGKGPTLMRAADLTEQAARRMLSDLDEWRLVNQQHDLAIG
ncbi:hypothetical protein ACUXST_001908 [Sphingomonas sp. F9_3S_D5_B_2]